MNTSLALTFFTPALMLLFIGLSTRFFPPSLGKSFILKSPDGWSQNRETWEKAHRFISQKYLMYGGVLAVYSGISLFLNKLELSIVGYVLFIVFFVLSHFQTRKFMGKNE